MTDRAKPRTLVSCLAASMALTATVALAGPPEPATFSIVAADPATGEVGVAVASRFFAVGAVVPFARAGVGAVATQASANTSYGPAVLDLLAHGVTPLEAIGVVTRNDESRSRRQLGAVSATGDAATFSGPECNAWAGGRSGPGYGGFDDRAIDVRVDDHAEPIVELGRLVDLALVNDLWNRGWAAFMQGERGTDLKWQEATLAKAEALGASVLPEELYDTAVIRLANGDAASARAALDRALALNPKLAAQAAGDTDLAGLREAEP